MPDDNPQASALDSTLADLLDLTLLAKHSHWNVSGPRFQSVHAFLHELAELAIVSADDVAERAVTLGHSPDGRAAKVASSSSLPTGAGGPVTDAETIAPFTAILDARSSIEDSTTRTKVTTPTNARTGKRSNANA